MIVLLLTMYWVFISALVIYSMFTFPYLGCVFFIFEGPNRALKSQVISECMQMRGRIV